MSDYASQLREIDLALQGTAPKSAEHAALVAVRQELVEVMKLLQDTSGSAVTSHDNNSTATTTTTNNNNHSDNDEDDDMFGSASTAQTNTAAADDNDEDSDDMFGATFNVDHVDLAELVAEARHGEDRRQFDGAFVKGQTPHDDEASAPSSAALPEAVRLRIEADTDAELEKRVRLELAAGTIVGRDLQRQWRRDVTKRFTAKYLNSTLADEDDGDDDGADGAESARVGHWEQYTKGVGSKLLQAMGWEAGKGLGLLLEGRPKPVGIAASLGRNGKPLAEDAHYGLGHKKRRRGAGDDTDDDDRGAARRRRREAKANVFDFLNRNVSSAVQSGSDAAEPPPLDADGNEARRLKAETRVSRQSMPIRELDKELAAMSQKRAMHTKTLAWLKGSVARNKKRDETMANRQRAKADAAAAAIRQCDAEIAEIQRILQMRTKGHKSLSSSSKLKF